MVLVIVDDLNDCPSLREAWNAAEVGGITVLESTGMGRLRQGKTTLLCLDPGFPVNKLQLRLLGMKAASIDFYDHRGDKLVQAVRAYYAEGTDADA